MDRDSSGPSVDLFLEDPTVPVDPLSGIQGSRDGGEGTSLFLHSTPLLGGRSGAHQDCTRNHK